jgi:2-polyprenyl-3-methyl-5-hydroxy-6-metoxy-1,4-benzoquinol methylase
VNGLKYARDVYRAVRRYQKVVRGVRSFPEFQEYFVHYQTKRTMYSSHSYMKQMVGSGKEVLDIGCGKGFLA